MEGVDQTIPVDELAAVAGAVAREAAAHVRRRRPELFGATPGHGEPPQPAAVNSTVQPVSTKSTVQPVSTKSTETDPVTLADTETERLIRSLLREARPDDEVLGEEDGGSRAVPSGVRWVVDPIDGTVNFMYGVPAYAVSIAAQVDGQSVAGVVVDVARDVTYGATLGGERGRRTPPGYAGRSAAIRSTGPNWRSSQRVSGTTRRAAGSRDASSPNCSLVSATSDASAPRPSTSAWSRPARSTPTTNTV